MKMKDLSWNESITKRFNNPLLPKYQKNNCR